MIKNILLIEDDDITIKILKLTISRHRFAENIISLRNGQEGVEYFQKLAAGEAGIVPDLIFLDINMPVMNGWDFLDEYSGSFAHLFPDVSICMLTSSTDPEDKLHAFHYSSVITFVSKPIFISELNMLKKHKNLKHFFDN
ncbi:response regulator [Telluribacter sp.]|jgi:CheY-like chemotaxis protein|uniref:response regulator n=1 Tax=Telluribacter sp. TaxID=1978767 RepID=UPI002E15E273|nr:response regulator [Telluribacter sp.]